MTSISSSQDLNAETVKALNDWQRREFVYGDSDCCSFVAFIANKLTGRDFSEFLTYSSEREAYDMIEAHGSFEALIDRVFGEPAEPNDGDPCMLELPIIGKVMGIKFGDTVVCVTKKGLTRMPTKYIIRSWTCRQ
jgi:hypothetical protein